MAMALSAIVFWSGRWAGESASKVSARNRSMPSAARVRATRRVWRTGWARPPGRLPRRRSSRSRFAASNSTWSAKTSGNCANRLEISRRRCSHAARSTTRAGAGGSTAVCGFSSAEVGRLVFFLGAHLLLGFDLQVAVKRARIAAVGGVPERARNGVAVVGEGKRHGGQRAVAVVAVGVVLGRGAQADLHVDQADSGFRCELVMAPYSAVMPTILASDTS